MNSVTVTNSRLWVDSCPLSQLNDGLARLDEADDDAVNWLKTTTATALAYELQLLRTMYTSSQCMQFLVANALNCIVPPFTRPIPSVRPSVHDKSEH